MDINGKMAGKNVVSEALAASRKYETQNEIDKNERPLFHVTPPVGCLLAEQIGLGLLLEGVLPPEVTPVMMPVPTAHCIAVTAKELTCA